MKASKEAIEKILERNVEQVIGREKLVSKMLSRKQLRIKHGVDVTSPMLHIGHAVDYWKMREFQELGHKVVFLIGDFTTKIGDPTGKSKTRPELDDKAIKENAKTYLKQVTKILIDDPKLLEVRKNSEWHGKMSSLELLSLLKKVTHAQLTERDMFQRRMKEGGEIYEHETIYPVLQAYDSVMLKSDLTVIGTDQLFNEIMGRKYQEIFGQEPQAIIATTITPGLDGKEKMSKSLNNYVAILDKPSEKFTKIMALKDSLVEHYFKVYTDLSLQDIEKIIKQSHPFEAKKRLAFEIVKRYDGEKAAKSADSEGVRAKRGELWVNFLTRNKFSNSNSEAKRLIDGGGVSFENEKIKNSKESIIKPGRAKIGKYKVVNITLK
ncbi:MAG: tyrosine--tRNA ligase [Patescibacteria group bacterium]